MIARQARVSVVVMRRWEPHDPGRSCLLHANPHYVTNRTTSQERQSPGVGRAGVPTQPNLGDNRGQQGINEPRVSGRSERSTRATKVARADGLPAGALAVAARLLPGSLALSHESKRPDPGIRPDLRFYLVGATGFEPVTPSVSGKCSPAELRARVVPIIRRVGCRCERVEAVPGIEPGYRVLQTLA